MITVHKFGGTCTDSSTNLHRILQIVQKQTYPTIIVVSAARGVTELIKHALEGYYSSEIFTQLIDNLEKLHLKLLQMETLPDNLNTVFVRFQRLLAGIEYTETVSEAIYDLVMSFGERIISQVLYSLMIKHDISAIVHEPENIIVTNGIFKDADISLESTSQNIDRLLRPCLDKYQVHIIPGFYGMSDEGVVNLIGRSGTDYTATAIASILNADNVTIWKDVFGLMSADPKIIPDAKNIKNLTYTEAAELAYFGAKLLHPKAAGPAREKNMPLYIRHFTDEDFVTLIQDKDDKQGFLLKSITYVQDLALIRVYTKPGLHSRQLLEKALHKISEIEPPISLSFSQTNIVFLVHKLRVDEAQGLLSELKPELANIEIEDDIGLLALVGDGIMDHSEIISQTLDTLSTSNIQIIMVSAGASMVTFNIVVCMSDLHNAMKIIHNKFF